MRIGFSSQNLKTITAHAGRTRRFLVYELAADGAATPLDPIELPPEMTLHEFHGQGPHPVDSLDVLVTKECGAGFLRRMGARGVVVVTSREDTDPASVLRGIAEGRIDISQPAAVPCGGGHGHGHDHDHDHGHGHGHGHGCCGQNR